MWLESTLFYSNLNCSRTIYSSCFCFLRYFQLFASDFMSWGNHTQALFTLTNVPALSCIAAPFRFACFLVPTWQNSCEFLVPRQRILYTVLSTVYYFFLLSSHSNWDFPFFFQHLLTTQCCSQVLLTCMFLLLTMLNIISYALGHFSFLWNVIQSLWQF